MGSHILIGFIMIIITTIIHSGITRMTVSLNKKESDSWVSKLQQNHILIWLSLTVLIIFCATIFESVIWAYCYQIFGAIGSFEEALYFSIVTFTTLGYGDIVLEENWRLLSSIQAINGIIIFGWSTAILLATVQRLHSK